MRTDKMNYTCDDCRITAVFRSYLKARAAGWAISKDYKNCYCPECAPAHRLGGENGKHATPRQWLPDGCEQLSIELK